MISEFTKVIEINPLDACAYYNRGLTKCHLDDYDGAVDDFSKAIDIDTMFAKAYFNRGAIKLLILGQEESGTMDLQKARELGVEDAEKVIRKYAN